MLIPLTHQARFCGIIPVYMGFTDPDVPDVVQKYWWLLVPFFIVEALAKLFCFVTRRDGIAFTHVQELPEVLFWQTND